MKKFRPPLKAPVKPRNPTRNRLQRQGSLFLLLLLVAPQAHACAICVSNLTYDRLRFSPVWLIALVAWLPLGVVADKAFRRSGIPNPHITKDLSKLLGVLVLSYIVGAQLLLAVVLVPFWLYRTWRASRVSVAPTWMKPALTITAAILLAAIPLSYLTLPLSASEPGIRQIAERTEADLRSGSSDPVVHADPFSYTLLNINVLAPFVQNNSFYRSGKLKPYSRVTSGTDQLVWSRGPDGDFAMPVGSGQSVLAMNSYERQRKLAPLSYDPTNGIMSPGDIFHFTQSR